MSRGGAKGGYNSAVWRMAQLALPVNYKEKNSLLGKIGVSPTTPRLIYRDALSDCDFENWKSPRLNFCLGEILDGWFSRYRPASLDFAVLHSWWGGFLMSLYERTVSLASDIDYQQLYSQMVHIELCRVSSKAIIQHARWNK